MQSHIFTKKEAKQLLEKLQILKKQIDKLREDYRLAVEEGDERECDAFYVSKRQINIKIDEYAELKEILKEATIIKAGKLGQNKVQVGCIVQLQLEGGTTKNFTLCDPLVVNPSKRKVSYKSLIGQALLDKKLGDKMEITYEGEKVHARVTEITRDN